MGDPTGSFLADLGFSLEWRGDETFTRIDISESHVSPLTGGVRPSVLATAADVIAGVLVSRADFPRIALTVHLTMHCFVTPASGGVCGTARFVKAGRTLSVVETVFVDDAKRRIGVSHATFMSSPRDTDVLAELPGFPTRSCTMTAPFGEQIGVRLVEPGVVELDCRDDILQASGTIQGGAAALLVELSAESTGTVVPTDLELHYLSAVGAGPVRAVATAGNERGVQVDVHDLGHGSGSPRMVFLGFVHGVARSDGVR